VVLIVVFVVAIVVIIIIGAPQKDFHSIGHAITRLIDGILVGIVIVIIIVIVGETILHFLFVSMFHCHSCRFLIVTVRRYVLSTYQ
jgi:hypothetical protein